MLKIRKDQMNALSEPMGDRFVDGLVEFLREEFEDARRERPDDLKPPVREQIEKARSYGLESKEQIATYVTAAWLLGPEFDAEFPAARDVLTSSAYTPDEKSDWLAEWVERMFYELGRKD